MNNYKFSILKDFHIEENHLSRGLMSKGLFFAFICVSILLISGIFLYINDKLTGEIHIINRHRSQAIVNRVDGTLSVFIRNGDTVKRDEILGTLNWGISKDDVIRVDSILSDLRMGSNLSPQLMQLQYFNLDEFRTEYDHFLSACREYEYVLYEDKSEDLIANKEREIGKLMGLVDLSESSKSIIENSYKIKKEHKDLDSNLFASGGLSKREWELNEIELNNLELDQNQIKTQIESSKLRMLELNSEILEIEEKKMKALQELKNKLDISIQRLTSQYQAVRRNKLIISNHDGLIKLSDNILNNNFVPKGEEIMQVQPLADSAEYYGNMYVDDYALGKISEHQRVIIRLNSFPEKEFGVLIGQVLSITKFDNSTNRNEVKIYIDPDLTTSYGIRLQPMSQLVGEADIILNRKSIIRYVINEIYNKSLNS